MTDWRPPVTKPLLAFGTPKRSGDRSTFRVTSPFGWRDDPLNPGSRVFHGGLDMGDFGSGADVVAAADGTVEAVGFLREPYSTSTTRYASGNYGGWMVTIRHPDGYRSIYAHMIPGSQPSHAVKAGALLGRVGDSGSAQGAPHLHFGIQLNGKDVDPWPLITAEDDDMPLPESRTAWAQGTAAASVRFRKEPSVDSEYYQLKAATTFDILIPLVTGGRYSLDGGKTWRNDWVQVARNSVGFVARPLLTNITATTEAKVLGSGDCSVQDAKLVKVKEVAEALIRAVG